VRSSRIAHSTVRPIGRDAATDRCQVGRRSRLDIAERPLLGFEGSATV
jgi:hypothetical protein